MQEHAGKKKKDLRILSLAGNEYHDYVQLRSWCSEDNTRADDSRYAPFSAVCITLLYISQLKTHGFHYSTAQDDCMLFYIQTRKWTLYLMELIFFKNRETAGKHFNSPRHEMRRLSMTLHHWTMFRHGVVAFCWCCLACLRLVDTVWFGPSTSSQWNIMRGGCILQFYFRTQENTVECATSWKFMFCHCRIEPIYWKICQWKMTSSPNRTCFISYKDYCNFSFKIKNKTKHQIFLNWKQVCVSLKDYIPCISTRLQKANNH